MDTVGDPRLMSAVAKQTEASPLADSGRFLASIKIYLPPQYDQQPFVWQHYLDQATSAKKPSPIWR